MTDQLINAASLARWRANPIAFIETVLINPETGEAFELLPSERAFLAYAFQLDDSGKLKFPELLYSCPKKSGKTTFAALHLLTMTLRFGGRFAEAYTIANDLRAGAGPCVRRGQAVMAAFHCWPFGHDDAVQDRVPRSGCHYIGFGQRLCRCGWRQSNNKLFR